MVQAEFLPVKTHDRCRFIADIEISDLADLHGGIFLMFEDQETGFFRGPDHLAQKLADIRPNFLLEEIFQALHFSQSYCNILFGERLEHVIHPVALERFQGIFIESGTEYHRAADLN